MRKVLILVMAVLLLSAIPTDVQAEEEYTTHFPITINHNIFFSGNASSGDGSIGNPWIIEDYLIQVDGAECPITINDTTDYFIIRNCYVSHTLYVGYSPAIQLKNIQNGIIENNVIIGGIYLDDVSGAKVTNNNITRGSTLGEGLQTSNISYNKFGDGFGISLSGNSKNNIITNNIFESNIYDFDLDAFTSNNTFYFNNFLDRYLLGVDDGTNNHWNSSEGYGNYWSDWTTPDSNFDGIVDNPYLINGTAGAYDYYPLTTPVDITVCEICPQTITSPFAIFSVLLIGLLVFTEVFRRRE